MVGDGESWGFDACRRGPMTRRPTHRTKQAAKEKGSVLEPLSLVTDGHIGNPPPPPPMRFLSPPIFFIIFISPPPFIFFIIPCIWSN